MRRKRRTSRKFLKRMQKKLIFLFLFVFLCLSALIGRLMYIGYISGEKYEKIILLQQGYDSKTIPYRRGDILDANGTLLATSVDVYNVIFDCYILNQNQEEDIRATVEAISSCFSEYPEAEEQELYRLLKEAPELRYKILIKRLPYKKIKPYVELLASAKEGGEEDGPQGRIVDKALVFEKEYIRKYPYKSFAASVIGFVSAENTGTTGLENYYNSTLNGLDGREYGYLNSDNNFARTVRDAKDGNTIVSTIDFNIQSIVEAKLKKFNDEHKDTVLTLPDDVSDKDPVREDMGFKNAAAIVMNPQSGEIYAMANYPTFNLNAPRKAKKYFTEEELQAQDKQDLLSRLWKNYCISDAIEPGSTMKPMTVACGLDTGNITGDETYLCKGYEEINGIPINCVNRFGHQTETVQKALMDSCNAALMQIGASIGADNLQAYQHIFGFGEKTGIDLPGESDGIIKSKMDALDLATNSFGQNVNCTMVQMAGAFSSLINGGQYYRPYMVKRILDAKGNVIETTKPTLLKETVSQETSDKIKTYLYATVDAGTAKTAKVNGYSMGGKTGTAEKAERDDINYLVSFIGYLPQENPQLVIYVVIDRPKVEEQAHSSYAQGIAKEILEEILPYMGLSPDEESVTPEEPMEE